MPQWDSINDDIKSRLPEFWKSDLFLEPVNRYTQDIAIQIIASLLSNFGVVQPLQVWKYLPEEYNWKHKYMQTTDELCSYRKVNKNTNEQIIQELAPSIIKKNNDEYKNTLCLKVPNTKRNCDAIITLKLTGNPDNKIEMIDELNIINAGQKITINNISNTSTIKILTEEGIILIDGVQKNNFVKGMFNKIRPQPINNDFDNLDVYDENKTTQIELESTNDICFEGNIELIKPVYVTEQHMRVATVSAFPIEWIRLYGFFCNEFNNKEEWVFLWEKKYPLKDRTVYDKIAKQYDCERFYIQVKLHGIGLPFNVGFPQSQYDSDPTFLTNTRLDYWGKYFGLPRRHYKPDISEDEEPYTYPKYYPYNIEQDYWYEERIVNEYRQTLEPIDTIYLQDTDVNNLAILEVIDPFMDDLWVYSETIAPTNDNEHETDDILPFYAMQEGEGQTWNDTSPLKLNNLDTAFVSLEPNNYESLNTKANKSKVLKLKFKTPNLPDNIKITGLELKFNGMTNIHSDSFILDDRTLMRLPFRYKKLNGDVFEKEEIFRINHYEESWQKGKGIYTIGGKEDLFGLDEIEKYQIEDEVSFDIAFTNNNDFIISNIELYNIKFKIYFETIEDTYEANVSFNKKEIIIGNNEDHINLKINLKNNGELPIVDKTIFIATPPELNIKNDTFYFNLDVGEEFTIGDTNDDEIKISIDRDNPITGMFDIIVFCDDKVIKNEILVKRGQ